MPRQSTIKRLPPAVRDKIGQLLDSGRTLDEILAHLDTLGVEVSRSALGRYKQHIDKVSERIRRSREISEALVRNLGEEPEGKTTRLNIELMHGVITDMLMQIPEPGEESLEGEQGTLVSINPMGAMLFAKALDHLSRAKRSDAALIEQLQEKARKEAEAKLDQATDEVAGEARRDKLTPEQVLERVKAIYRGEA